VPVSLPLRRFNVLSTADPDVALESVRSRQPGSRSIVPLSGPSWSLVSNAIMLGPVTLVATVSGGYTIDNEFDRYVRLLVPLHGELTLATGSDTADLGRAEAAFVYASRGRMIFQPNSALVLVSARADATAEAMRLLECELDPVVLADRVAGRTTLPGIAALRRAVMTAVRDLEDTPAPLLGLERFRRARAETLLLNLASVLVDATGSGGASTAPRSRVLRRALEYLEATEPDAFSYADLAAAAGTSLRTVQSAFRRELDMSVSAYVRRHRLARARALLRAGGSALTVLEVAQAVGFPHPGRFAAAYHAAFGEYPSQTARRGG